MPAARRSSQLDARRALDRLRAMRGDRSRQREFAIELLEQSDSPEVLPAVLDVLAQQPGSDLRPLLHAKFAALEPGPRKRDPGGFVRAAIIRVLQAVAGPEDVPVFERAIAAYEPTPADTNGPTILRAAGLVALAAVDARSAALQAVTLLARPDRSSNMTGEPALTAVRVLAALGEEMALYLFALAGLSPLSVAHATSPEVVAEAVRGLSSLPASHLLAMFNVSSSNDAVIEAAFIDVAIEHSPDAALTTWLATFLRTTRNDDLYAFAVTSIVAKHGDHLLTMLQSVAATETAPARLRTLESSLAMLAGDSRVDAALAEIRTRIALSS